MNQAFNFLGLKIESGQAKNGPGHADQEIRNFLKILNSEFSYIDHGSIPRQVENSNRFQIKHNEDLKKIQWQDYEVAFHKIQSLLATDQLLVNWGGDHSVGISTVGAFCNSYQDGYVLWVDAHADINLPQHSPTGNLHGMPLALLLNLQNSGSENLPWMKNFLSPDKLIYLGLRDIDPFEKQILDDLKIKYFTSETLHQHGIEKAIKKILSLTAEHPLHISFDIDCMSPSEAPSTGLHVPEGLSNSQMTILADFLSLHPNLKSLDMTEINPLIGSSEDVLQTNLIALQFLKTILGKNKLQLRRVHDDTGRANQRNNSFAMESCS